METKQSIVIGSLVSSWEVIQTHFKILLELENLSHPHWSIAFRLKWKGSEIRNDESDNDLFQDQSRPHLCSHPFWPLNHDSNRWPLRLHYSSGMEATDSTGYQNLLCAFPIFSLLICRSSLLDSLLSIPVPCTLKLWKGTEICEGPEWTWTWILPASLQYGIQHCLVSLMRLNQRTPMNHTVLELLTHKHCEIINGCYFKLLSLWWFVMAAIEN